MDMLFGLLGLLVVLVCLGGAAFVGYIFVRRFWLQSGEDRNGDAMMSVRRDLRSVLDSITLRMILVAFLGLVMLIPLAFVDDIVDERHGLYQSVLRDIAGSWGEQQTLSAPLLVVPYVERFDTKENVRDKNGHVQTISRTKRTLDAAVTLPHTLDIRLTLSEAFRRRGIYQSLVYNAEITLSGTFASRPAVEELSEHIERIDWHKAYLVFGLSDTRAIHEVAALKWNDTEWPLSPGTRQTKLVEAGFHAPLGDELSQSQGGHRFELRFSVNGSEAFLFAPLGQTTEVHMTSTWPHPSFIGKVLPGQYTVRSDGFDANWAIPHLARHYPQLWSLNRASYDVNSFTAEVRLFEPVFLYSLVTRAVKYGLLFIALTFMIFLIFEVTVQARLHVVQYGLIGLALTLFYLTLLSLAEHIDFLPAYLSASSIIILMITCYTAAALRSAVRATIIFVLLIGLYTLLYSLLQLEDYALLMGTGLLLAVVIVLMYVTRHMRSGTAGEEADELADSGHSTSPG